MAHCGSEGYVLQDGSHRSTQENKRSKEGSDSWEENRKGIGKERQYLYKAVLGDQTTLWRKYGFHKVFRCLSSDEHEPIAVTIMSETPQLSLLLKWVVTGRGAWWRISWRCWRKLSTKRILFLQRIPVTSTLIFFLYLLQKSVYFVFNRPDSDCDELWTNFSSAWTYRESCQNKINYDNLIRSLNQPLPPNKVCCTLLRFMSLCIQFPFVVAHAVSMSFFCCSCRIHRFRDIYRSF